MTQSPFGRRILVVDDDRGLRHVLAELLQEAGHQVGSAGDGPEALAMLGDGSGFDLVASEYERARRPGSHPQHGVAAVGDRHDRR